MDTNSDGVVEPATRAGGVPLPTVAAVDGADADYHESNDRCTRHGWTHPNVAIAWQTLALASGAVTVCVSVSVSVSVSVCVFVGVSASAARVTRLARLRIFAVQVARRQRPSSPHVSAQCA
jgi:hypothetical protein